MVIISPKAKYHYEIERLTALFFPLDNFLTKENFEGENEYIFTDISNKNNKIVIQIKIKYDTIKKEYTFTEDLQELDFLNEEMLLCQKLFKVLCEITGKNPKWGILTGVRPVGLLGRNIEKGENLKDIENLYLNKYLLSKEKFDLALKTYYNEKKILNKSTKDSYSLYVGIPFCPSRCSYCSFVSQSIEKAGNLIAPYVEKLCQEIIKTAEIAEKLQLKLRTIYIGGGTPTILKADELAKVMHTISDNFKLNEVWEYTVEAGRADTITEEKLKVIKEYGATRISINPQTFNDDVLKAIGRKHTATDTIDKFLIARKLGFDNINMDIIAGLPTDTYESFKNTVDKLIELSPENITVHTLSVKHNAKLNDENAKIFLEQSDLADKMVSYSQNAILSKNYMPYYLYRQKNMLSNLENTGFCKDGYEGLYNVYIMDETHSILACGAGSMTKLLLPKSNEIKRIANLKLPYEYINNFSDILSRKDRVKDFYETDNI